MAPPRISFASTGSLKGRFFSLEKSQLQLLHLHNDGTSSIRGESFLFLIQLYIGDIGAIHRCYPMKELQSPLVISANASYFPTFTV